MRKMSLREVACLLVLLAQDVFAGKGVDVFGPGGLAGLEEEDIFHLLGQNKSGPEDNATMVEWIESLGGNGSREFWTINYYDGRPGNPYYGE